MSSKSCFIQRQVIVSEVKQISIGGAKFEIM